MEKLKLVIADDEALICSLLTSIIRFDELDLELAGIVHNGSDLMQLIETSEPDIVLSDITMPVMDGLEVIRRCYEAKRSCKFIIISGYQQFEYAQNALRYEVEDYLLKPLNPEEVNNALSKTAGKLRESRITSPPSDYTESVRASFVNKTISAYHGIFPPLEEINYKNYTRFHSGVFRMVSLCLWYQEDVLESSDSLYTLLRKMRELLVQTFDDLCYDAVLSVSNTKVTSLLNYPEAAEKNVIDRIYRLARDSRGIVDLFSGFSLSVCASAAYQQLSESDNALDELRSASLYHLLKPSENLFFYQEHSVNIEHLEEKLSEIQEDARQAFSVLNAEGFQAAAAELFSLPRDMLCSKYGARCLRNIRKDLSTAMREIGGDLLEDRRYTQIELNILLGLHSSRTFIDYSIRYIRLLSEYMQIVADAVNKKKSKPIRFACTYIDSHYSEHLTLEQMADMVHLSPVYFSVLFKKETKKTFSEYLVDLRIEKACRLLCDSDNTIGEIAVAVGFQDVPHFSKTFRKHIGTKPSEYRKLYG